LRALEIPDTSRCVTHAASFSHAAFADRVRAWVNEAGWGRPVTSGG
jgi:hypothetical protein